MSTPSLPHFIFFILLFIFSVHSQYECAQICNAEFPTCQVAQCNNELGICEDGFLKEPLPQGCCTADSDCFVDDSCIDSRCDENTNECINVDICSYSYVDDPEICRSSRDCDDSNPCTKQKCIENFCVTSPNPDTTNPECCMDVSDCGSFPCTNSYCLQDSFVCYYVPNNTCVENAYNIDYYGYNIYDQIQISSTSTDDRPDVDSIVGAVIGFIILGSLLFAFFIVFLLMVTQKIVRKFTSETEE